MNLSDGTNYELIYIPIGIKAGRLISPTENFNYFTSSDIGGYWDNFNVEPIAITKNELPSVVE